MLYKIELQNFYCFRDQQIIDLRVRGSVPEAEDRFRPIYPGSSDRAPVAVMLFGANASGKSTVLRALTLLKNFITARGDFTPLGMLSPFAQEAYLSMPIRLAVEAGVADSTETGGGGSGVWRYEVEFSTINGVVMGIVSEHLKRRLHGQIRFARIISRMGSDVLGSDEFKLKGFETPVSVVPATTSIIAHLATWKHPKAVAIVEYFQRFILANMAHERIEVADQQLIDYLSANGTVVDNINNNLSRLDVGIDAIEVKRDLHPSQLFFRHQGLSRSLGWHLQSHGTRSLIKILPLIIPALAGGGLAVVDELDIALHPNVLPEVMRWFYDADRNVHSSQIIATLHAATLLDDLTKEQVYFTEKASDGSASVFGLSEIKGVRRFENFSRKYLGGVFGAVPQLG